MESQNENKENEEEEQVEEVPKVQNESIPVEKKRKGKPYTVDIELQLETYRSFSKQLLDSSNNIRPASADVYKQIGEKFENKVSSKGIRMAVVNNAKQIFGSDFSNAEISRKDEKKVEKKNDALLELCDEYSTDALTVTMDIHEKYTDTFKIVDIVSKASQQTHKALRPGWSDALHEIIVEKTGTHCVFQFKRANIISDEFVAIASCSECRGQITATSFGNRKNVEVKIIHGDGEHTYTKKRRLTIARAKALVPALKSDSVYNVHSDLINEYDPESEFIPRNYVSRKQLENVKHNHINKTTNSYAALRNMMYEEYNGIIKEIGSDPFFVIFWTPAQKFLYQQNAKNGPIVISVDATGGLISTSQLTAEISKKIGSPHIFLYLICLKMHNGKSIPIAQFLSAQQDTTKIKYFFERYAEEFGDADVVIEDGGKAMQKAAIIKFAGCTDKIDYLNKCFAVLNNEQGTLPKSFVRNDVFHFVCNLHKNQVFDRVGTQVKHFYKCIIGIIMQEPSYETIKTIVRDMLILANYAIEGVLEDGTETPTAKSRIHLQRLIRTHDTSFFSNEVQECDGEVFLNETSDEESILASKYNTSNIKWYADMLNEIQEKAKSFDSAASNLTSNVSMNNYQCVGLNVFLQELLLELPLWSCVMCGHFNVPIALGNSCDVERMYALIKQTIFHNYKLPVSAVVFIENMVKRINSITTLTKMNMKQSALQRLSEMGDEFEPEENDISIATNEKQNVS